MEFWQGVLTYIIVTVVSTFISWGLTLLTKIISSKIKDQDIARFLLEAAEIIDSSVKSTYQTYVQSLKKQGDFDLSAQKVALNMATEKAKSQMSSKLSSFLEKTFGDITKWVEQKIESRIYELKNEAKQEDVRKPEE